MEQGTNKETWLFSKKVLDLAGQCPYVYIVKTRNPNRSKPMIAQTLLNNKPWNPGNALLAKMTGLPNLDNINDVERLRSLRDIALRKLDGMHRQGGNPLRYTTAAGLYADRAAEKAIEAE